MIQKEKLEREYGINSNIQKNNINDAIKNNKISYNRKERGGVVGKRTRRSSNSK